MSEKCEAVDILALKIGGRIDEEQRGTTVRPAVQQGVVGTAEKTDSEKREAIIRPGYRTTISHYAVQEKTSSSSPKPPS